MVPTATIVIRSASPLAGESAPHQSGYVSASPQQQQATQHAALEQQQLLRGTTLPSKSEIIFEGVRKALSTIVERSKNTLEITLTIKSPSSIAISIDGNIPPVPLAPEFRRFEIPGFGPHRTTRLIVRPASHPQGKPCMELDVGAFLLSNGCGFEDAEPTWYAIKRNMTHDELVAWFDGWLGR